MTAPTTSGSAYPPAVEELIPKARELADQLGETPSRNRLMREFRVGSPKATALREALVKEMETRQLAEKLRTNRVTQAGRRGSLRPVPPLPPDEPDTTEPIESLEAEAPPVQSDPDDEIADLAALPTKDGHPEPVTEATADLAPVTTVRRVAAWPVLLLAAPAFVAIWAGWVELGRLTGFGKVNLLPGIGSGWVINTAISLPVGVETYAAYALWVWLSGNAQLTARRFAKWSAIASLAIGALGQIAYHLMAAAGWAAAPWLITAAVACLPVLVLGMGAALAHLMHLPPDQS